MKYPDSTVAILNDGYSVITVDDGCYTIRNFSDNEWRFSAWIFPEALEILKRLPDDPRRAPVLKRTVWVVGSPDDCNFFPVANGIEYKRLVKSEQIYGLVNPEIVWLDDWWKHVPNPLDLLYTIISRSR